MEARVNAKLMAAAGYLACCLPVFGGKRAVLVMSPESGYCFSLYPVRNIQLMATRQAAMIAVMTARLDQTGTSATE